jgi:hypothetical protein
MNVLTWGRLALAEWRRYRQWRQRTGNRLKGIFIDEPLKSSTRNLFGAMGIPIYQVALPSRFH